MYLRVSSFLLLSLLFNIYEINCNSVESISSYRLPNNSYPLKYDLKLKVNLEQKSTLFEGNVKVHVKIKEESDFIIIHSKDISLKKLILIDLNQDIKYENISYRFDELKDFMIIKLPRKFSPESEILVNILYYGQIIEASDDNTYNKGILIANYLEQNVTEYYMFTDLEATYARQCFPCYDEPALRAPFSLQIEHHSSYNSIANMPVISKIVSNQIDDYVITVFQETPAMQTYLLAFFISKMKYIQNNDLNIQQRIYARDSRIDNGDVNYAVDLLDKMLKTFEDYFQVSYSLPKLDHVIAPHFYTAIENWGVIGYSERFVFDSEKLVNVRTFLHEIAHQFFGNLVAPKWWSYVWLNEGFAKFYDIEMAKIILPEEIESINEYWQNVRYYALKDDIASSSLNFYAETPDEISEKFSYVAYYKGAAILYMFQEAIGLETWKKGMKYYLDDNKYSSVEPRDLHVALQKAVNEDRLNDLIDVEFLMKPWEDFPGYPIISVSLENQTIKLSQTSLINDENDKEMIFTIPVTYFTSSDPDFDNLSCKFWMIDKEYEITDFTADWIIFNSQQIGFYKVDYDDNLWMKIIDQLYMEHSVIHQYNRASIVYEMSQEFHDKNFTNSDIQKVILYLQKEDEIYPLMASQNLIRIFVTFYQSEMKEILRKSLQTIYDKTKGQENAGTIRELACKMRIDSCISDNINEMLNGLGQSHIEFDFIYCSALKFANETVFEIYYNTTKLLRHQKKSYLFLYGLGCVENPVLFERTVNIFIDPEWNPSEFDLLDVKNLLSNMKSYQKVEVFMKFLEKNYSKIENINPSMLVNIISNLKEKLKNENHKKWLVEIEMAANEIDEDE